ncbi:unnamed protein product [Phytophthora fragariaefolia]|uniref:Unnamed protein product n=1 Tax=Phytophthora fragariaefolia TaxID=1490495 RepID=A0A9W6WZ52_9STRA|nr:unnamed protein product [Phytophthora fragariaefolia]
MTVTSAVNLCPLPFAKMPRPSEKSPLLKEPDTASLEDPQPNEGASVWELRVLLVPCKCRSLPIDEGDPLFANGLNSRARRLLAKDVGTGTNLYS